MSSENDLNATAQEKNVKTETTRALVSNGFLEMCLLAVKSITLFSENLQSSTDDRPVAAANVCDAFQIPDDMDSFVYYPFADQTSLSLADDGNSASKIYALSMSTLEVFLRIIYYVVKSSESLTQGKIGKDSNESLKYMLCEIMVNRNMQHFRRTIRKTLFYLCGSKESYKLLKDQHFLNLHLKHLFAFLTPSTKPVCIEEMNKITDGLKSSLEIALIRPGSWQKYCISKSLALVTLFKAACNTDVDVIHLTIMKLIQAAICNNEKAAPVVVATTNNQDELYKHFAFNEQLAAQLTENLWMNNDLNFSSTLKDYIIKFLIYPCPATIKQQSHQIVVELLGKSQIMDNILFKVIGSLMEQHTNSALVSACLMDLLSAIVMQKEFTTACAVHEVSPFVNRCLKMFSDYTKMLVQHPNAQVYSYLHQVLDSEYYYFDSDGCLNCNYIEQPFTNVKLSTAKADARFTTSTLFIKLVQTYCISHIILRITDIKKAKMLKKLKVYYCNKNVQGIVELKTNLNIWKLAKVVNLDAGQTDLRIEFSVPIIARNLMIEYADFYNTVLGCTDTVQCPRCSAMVSSNPGMCGNCGENVFQCHKCRAINYDEKVSLYIDNYNF